MHFTFIQFPQFMIHLEGRFLLHSIEMKYGKIEVVLWKSKFHCPFEMNVERYINLLIIASKTLPIKNRT